MSVSFSLNIQVLTTIQYAYAHLYKVIFVSLFCLFYRTHSSAVVTLVRSTSTAVYCPEPYPASVASEIILHLNNYDRGNLEHGSALLTLGTYF